MNSHFLKKQHDSKSIKRIGLIVNPIKISEYELDFIKHCRADPLLDIRLILIKKNKLEKFKFSEIIWTLLISLERLKLYFSDLSSHFNISNLGETPELAEIASYNISSGIYDDLKNHDFHSIVSFNYRRDLQDINNATESDVIFFYKGLFNLSNSMIGFNEIIESDPSSSFSIMKIEKGKDDNAKVLFQGSFASSLYFSSNQANIFSRRNYYLLAILGNNLDISEHSSKDFSIGVSKLNNIPSTPSILEQLLYLQKIVRSFFSISIIRLLNHKITWSVFYSKKDWKSITYSGDQPIPNPAKGYLADPFVLDYQDRSYVFLERLDYFDNKGKIAAYEIGDFPPKDLGIIIEEDFHLSYPFIFKFESNVYLIPESSNNNDIRLYKCDSFPDQWSLHSIILDQVSAADSMVFQYQERWWLFTNLNPSNTNDHCSELFIFSSDHLLTGPWLPHSKNPIYIDPKKARNGGIIFDGEDIYRVAQEQGYGIYGKNINIKKIVLLDDKNYIEERVSSIKISDLKDCLNTHHLHTNSSYSVYDKWDLK